MIEVLSEDYVRTARAKGLDSRVMHFKHALRNTLLAISMGAISGGALVVETVFGWPGLGFLLLDSIAKGDREVVRGLLMINAAFVILFNLLADVSYDFLDPRVGRDG